MEYQTKVRQLRVARRIRRGTRTPRRELTIMLIDRRCPKPLSVVLSHRIDCGLRDGTQISQQIA